MKNLNEDIFRLKNLMNINEYSKVSDSYDNVDFLDGAVGSSKPSQDRINPALLKDIDTAAKNAGVKVSVTTAVSGHVSLPSRHPSGNAVDIAIINGKAVRKSNREDADKFVDALVSMGYTKNKEVGSKKAVLTFGFPKHDDHVHVSNTSDSPTEDVDLKIGEKGSFSDFLKLGLDKILSLFMGNKSTDSDNLLSKVLGLKEGYYDRYYKSTTSTGDDFIIPKSKNPRIKSPVSGVIDYGISSYRNTFTIRHEQDGEVMYLEFKNITNSRFSVGDKVKSGDDIGEAADDVRVSLYSQRKSQINVNNPPKSKSGETEKDTEDTEPGLSRYAMKTKFKKPELSKYAMKTEFEKPGLSQYAMKTKFEKPGLSQYAVQEGNNKKINEDIEKIKRLLK
jgi:hypothetical protein